MNSYRTEDIRNLALMGQDGAGKTTLTEKLLYQAGAIKSPGSVEKGNTVSDFEPDEQRYHHSLHTSVVGLDYDGTHINLLDTPGFPDFIGQTLSAAPAVDAPAPPEPGHHQPHVAVGPVFYRQLERAVKVAGLVVTMQPPAKMDLERTADAADRGGTRRRPGRLHAMTRRRCARLPRPR